jgi:hypothetical protein
VETAQAGLDEPATRQPRRESEPGDSAQPLGPWELYRALNDAMDEAYGLFDLSNREVRFALILMGGLNGALVLAAVRTDFGALLSPMERTIEGAAIGVYALLALLFLLQAIEALRPGKFRPRLQAWPKERHDHPIGVRYYEDVVQRNTEAHWAAWQRVTIGQLNAELAIQCHSLCLKNQARKVALRRLYNSLRVLTLVFAVIFILFTVFTQF